MINISKIVFALIGLVSFFNVTSNAGAESTIKLQNASVERCLNVHGRDNTDGGSVTLYACADTSDQEWDVVSSNDNWIKLKNRSSGRCLNIHRGQEDREGGLISVYSCANTPDQDWRIIPLGTHIQLQNRSTGRCLNIHKGKHNFNGAPATSYTCANTTDQKWTMSTIGSDGTVNQLSEAVIINWLLNRDRFAEETRSAIQERELADAIASGNLRVVEEPPSVEIIVLDEYVLGPNLGDFVVTNESRRAQVQPKVNVIVVGRDPKGLKFIELLDISIEPYCAEKPQNPKGIPSYYAAPSHTIPGKRSETPASSAIAETIITVTKFLDLHGGAKEASRWCPKDRPLLGDVSVRLQAEAIDVKVVVA
jgi:WD40 repeat protein